MDLVGISSLAGAHNELLTERMDLLGERKLDIPMVVGGIIPDADARRLLDLGVKACFGPGQDVIEIIEQLVDLLDTCLSARYRRISSQEWPTL